MATHHVGALPGRPDHLTFTCLAHPRSVPGMGVPRVMIG